MERSEAIDIIRKNWPKDIQYTEALRTLIPELKESEDEQHHKWILEYLYDGLRKSDEQFKDQFNCAIAWFKKQGEHIKFLESVQIGDEVTRNPDGVLVNLSLFKRLAEQTEQNLANSAKTCKDEPKFKIGDWVRAISSGNILKILSVNDGLYRVLCYDGVEANYPIEVEKDLAYWTIQDAKDGDVLVYEEEIFMIKSYALWNKIVYHCCYDGKILHKHSIYESWGKEDFDKVHPATEEQRDLLFQKIKEAGYEWDAEKKELRKIEQKPSVEICPHSIRSKSYLETGYPVEQNPAWSEDDEKMFEFWNLYYEHKVGDWPNKDVVENLEKFRDWLKSLKDRVQPQPKSDWNNNDEINFNRLMAICADERVRKSSAFSEKEIKDLMAWFESIKKRVQPQWKPSDEQMDALDDVISSRDVKYNILSELWNDLKKLKG